MPLSYLTSELGEHFFSEDKREEVFKEADTRLNTLIENNFKNIALELEGQDHYQFLRAYTAGLQEFIEALLFYQFMKTGAIQPCSYLNEKFSYATEEDKTSKLVMPIPMPEYFLGLGDFTGELMRRCINNLSSGNLEDCFKISNFVKHIYTGFLSMCKALIIFCDLSYVYRMQHVRIQRFRKEKLYT